MNVGELIQQLQNYSSEKRVIVEGYESGYDEVNTIEEQTIQPDKAHEWWNGEFKSGKDDSSNLIEVAILLTN